jgi:glycosyltransferase involved in cell wall biosynthesis
MNILSIVIAAYNEQVALPLLLDSLINQVDTDISSVPIVIADNNSTDETLNVIKKYQDMDLDITIVKGGITPVAKNNGARATDAEYLLLLDADVTFPPHFISCVIDEINTSNKDIYTFNFRCSNKQLRTSLMWHVLNILNKIKIFGNIGVGSCMLTKSSSFSNKNGLIEDIVFGDDVSYYRKFNKSQMGKVDCEVYLNPRRFNRLGFWNVLSFYTKSFFYTLFTKNYQDHDKNDYYDS